MPKATPKKRGRPSKAQKTTSPAPTTKRRGRPPTKATTTNGEAPAAVPAKRRGRPPKTASSSSAAVQPQAKNRVAKKSTPKTKKSTAKKTTAAGGYAITCKAISEGYPDIDKDDLGLDISESSTPGVYEASFDFGVMTGVMVLSADEKLLEAHIEELEEEDSDNDNDSEASAAPPAKKAPTAKATTGSGGGAGLTYHLEWRGVSSDALGKVKYSGPYAGAVKFTSKTFKKFSGTVDLAFVGGSVEITGGEGDG